MKINYYTDQGVQVPHLRRQIISRWIKQVANELGKSLGEISYKFTNDTGILEANKLFLQHDYFTDILTFDSSPAGSSYIAGDILISLETVASNAEKFNVPYEEELHRVLIHGVLHLAGLDDQTPQEEKLMRLAEDRALILLRRLVGDRPFLST
ncbi:MAG: rRNA maturation RNase YbeY [Bacteroidales bacterium]|nr:rRNA maturation RNase YbeY [Porphyromonas sp.]MDD6933890.1 rRNA maturation RNase YbeY [Bacteroidales bacterium]MDY3102387.1 rRNA maturation RNase YbeY [Porphyromonas sp.]